VADECRIAVVDPYPLFRCGVLQTLQRCEDLTVVAEGATAKHAMRFVRKGQLDILVLEAAVSNSLEVIDAVLRVLPNLRLIVLASAEDHEHATSAIQAGAAGYVIKGISGAGLVNVIEAIRRGELYITPDFACRLLTKPEWLPAYGEPCLSRSLTKP
jgi:two-component system, NarL family, nitrate/nitrite response regulator NarL